MIKQVKIERFLYSNQGVLGRLYLDSSYVCHTLELPFYGNLRNVSCIHEGHYSLVKHISPKFGHCFLINNVSDRSDILIHVGNTMKDTEGCILVGDKIGFLDEKLAVLNSKKTMTRLENIIDLAELEIVRVV